MSLSLILCFFTYFISIIIIFSNIYIFKCKIKEKLTFFEKLVFISYFLIPVLNIIYSLFFIFIYCFEENEENVKI